MATYTSHRLIMEKVEIANFCFLTGDIWVLFLEKCLLSSALRFRWPSSWSLVLIGCWCPKKDKFLKKSLKIFSSETVCFMRLILCIHVAGISLYKKLFFVPVKICYSCSLIFIYVEKRLLSNALRLRWPSSWSLILIGCWGPKKGKFSKTIFKNLLLRNCLLYEADTLHTCSWH